MLDAAALGERDGWTCWVCRRDVDPGAPRDSSHAGSVDHVVPRSRGGTNEDSNLRLAHQRCNRQRGSRLPELEWPRDLHVIDPSPLWPVVQRVQRRPGWEIVALVPPGDEAALTWLRSALALVSPGLRARLHPLTGELSALQVHDEERSR